VGFGGLLDGEKEHVSRGGSACGKLVCFWCLGRTALQVDGTEALQVPKRVVDFADVVLVLLRTDVAELVVLLLRTDVAETVWEVVELLAA